MAKQNPITKISLFQFLIDLPEALIRVTLRRVFRFFFATNTHASKVSILSNTARQIEDSHKGLRIISIEVLDGFSVYHGLTTKMVGEEKLEKLRLQLIKLLRNENIFISKQPHNPKLLKFVIQN